MKTICFVLCLIVCISINPLSGQDIKFYPIPSFNVIVDPSANFQEISITNTKARREEHVHIAHANNPDTTSCYAEVTIYSLDHQDVLGPYTVNCEETLSVEIDDREWGVIVTSIIKVKVSVWIDLEGQLKKMTGSFMHSKEQEICDPD